MSNCQTYDDCKREGLRVSAAAAIRELKRHGADGYLTAKGDALVIVLSAVDRESKEIVVRQRVRRGPDGLFRATSILDVLGY